MTVADDRILQACELYAAAFSCREDAYSIWTGTQWRAVREPLTPEVVLNAFATRNPVSAYVLGPDAYGHLAMLDIDREDGYALGKRVLAHMESIGGLAYLEKSRRGCHLWIPLHERRPAVHTRRALKALIKESGLPDDPKIELRPGSDRLNDPESLGHCIRMPTMPHQTTGIRYVLVSSRGEKLPGTIPEMILALDFCPVEVMDDLAMRAPVPKVTSPPRDLRYSDGEPLVEESATAILIEVAPWARPGKLGRCPFHDDKRPSLSILRDDQRAICHSTGSGCPADNNGRGRGTHELREMVDQLMGHRL